MDNATPTAAPGHSATSCTVIDALADLYRQWRAVHPDARRSEFVALAEAATKPQQAAMFGPGAVPATHSRMPAALGSDTDVWFADFWRTWPRKVGKGDARRAWARAVRRTGDPAVILVGARRYAADPHLPELQFVPHPATWLNGDRWEDGPLPPRPGPVPSRTTRAIAGLARRPGLPALPAAGR